MFIPENDGLHLILLFYFVFKPFDIPMVEIIAPYDTVGQLDC